MKQLIRALRHPRAYTWWALRPWRRHSLVLFLGGLIYVAIGSAYILANPTNQMAERIAPMSVWGAMFAATGTLAILSSRWPPASEKWGYSALSGTSAFWAALYFAAVFVVGGTTLTGGLVWALVAFMWWAISGLDNPHDRILDDQVG